MEEKISVYIYLRLQFLVTFNKIHKWSAWDIDLHIAIYYTVNNTTLDKLVSTQALFTIMELEWFWQVQLNKFKAIFL